MLQYLFYIYLKPEVINVKKGRTTEKKYLVVGQPSIDKWEFVNDDNEFDAVDKHRCTFAGLYTVDTNNEEKLNVEPEKVKKGPFGRPIKEEK